MNSLASRKQLLIAESELNRAQLVQEMQMLAGEVQALTSQARTVSTLVSSATLIIAGLMAVGCKKPAPEKNSWWQTILKGAGFFSTIWSEFRSRSCERDEN